MALQGLRTSTNYATDERPKNWREGILKLWPNGKAPLTGLTSMMKKRSVDDPEFKWWDKELDDRRNALGANLTTTNTTVALASGSNGKSLKQGDILYVEQTTEQIRVSVDPTSDTSISVTRGWAGTTAATVDFDGVGINPNLLVIGNANREGSLAPTGINFDPTKRTNYTQIFRNTLEMTRTGMKTRLRTGDQVKEAKRECLEMHSMDMERAFWLGKSVETTENGTPLRSTNGIMNFVDSGNIVDVNAAYGSGLTMLGLEEYLYNMFKFGSDEKMGFCGNRALLTLQQVVRKNSTWNFESGITEFGMNVTKFMCPFGTLILKTHPLFNNVTGGTTTGTAYYGMESWIVALDMENIKYVYFDDTKYETDLQANSMDGMKSGYLTEAGLEVHHPTSHYVMKNVVSAAADA